MLSLYRNLPVMSEAEAGSIGDATIALVGACLAPSMERIEEARGLIDQTMLDRVRRHIEARLADPRLTPSAICIAVGTSLSTPYLLFRHCAGSPPVVQDNSIALCVGSALYVPVLY